jgi:uncharacterized protein
MKILIDIGHPAHVHYFRNIIKIMEERGHSFFIIAKNRNITYELLKHYNIPFVKRKDYPSTLIGKLINIPLTDLMVIKKAMQFKPDIMMGFSGTHIAHAGKILNIPSIVLDDTDHAKLAHLSYKSFATQIITPACFGKDFGPKHIRFQGYMDLCYLHPDLFKPCRNIRDLLNISKSDKFVLLRFISWGASHDIGQSGIANEIKIELIKLFKERGYKVFISAEGLLSSDFEQYRISISPELIHSVLYEADIFIGESGTMATEAAILGTPSVFVNSLNAGVFQELAHYGLLYSFRNSNDLLDQIIKLLEIESLKEQHKIRREKLLNEKINVTDLLVWFIENYPESVAIMKENLGYQYKF